MYFKDKDACYSSPYKNECTAVSNLLKIKIQQTGLRFEHT